MDIPLRQRLLCVWSPNWAIETWRRRHPGAPRDRPFALITATRGVRRLTALDEAATRLGLFKGQAAADAAALVPELLTHDADPAADAVALEALCDWSARFSPAVAPDPPDGFFLDITGVARLWGSEAHLAAELISRLAANGLSARAAIASTPGAAWAAAHFGANGAVIAPGEEAQALRALPVTALRCEPAATAQLARLGLVTMGHLMRLPRAQITRRFGPEVVLRLDQALGRTGEALIFRRPPEPWFARLAFAEPISAPEDLARVTIDIAALLCARLEAQGLGARRFRLVFHGVDDRARGLEVGLALPGRDPGALNRLFHPKLETIDPGFGIEVVTLTAGETAPLAARQPSWALDDQTAGQDVSREDLAPLIDRLVNRLGEGAIWRAAPFPSHLPERASATLAPLATPQGTQTWDPDLPRPLRLFRRPERVEVVAPAPDDPPRLFRWRGLAHRVRLAEGPERLAPEWWRLPFEAAGDSEARDYYRVEDEAGARFWLFRAGPYRSDQPARWWLHGLF
jgi:protein ImuB